MSYFNGQESWVCDLTRENEIPLKSTYSKQVVTG